RRSKCRRSGSHGGRPSSTLCQNIIRYLSGYVCIPCVDISIILGPWRTRFVTILHVDISIARILAFTLRWTESLAILHVDIAIHTEYNSSATPTLSISTLVLMAE